MIYRYQPCEWLQFIVRVADMHFSILTDGSPKHTFEARKILKDTNGPKSESLRSYVLTTLQN